MNDKEKAKAYDEAIERAKDLYNQGLINPPLEYIFPELNEDEKTKKEICDFICWVRDRGSITMEQREKVDSWIAWLEKQVSPDMVADAYLRGCNDTEKKWLEEQCEQTSADKAESKFKVGDWIVKNNTTNKPVQIVSYEERTDTTLVWFSNGTGTDVEFLCGYHLWTIQDAKDGEVLVDKCGNIGIYQGDKNTVTWNSYCYCGVNKVFYDEGSHEFPCYPATKEQRDTLFKAIKDAGYEWDDEKKELRQLTQSVTKTSEQVLSEEDEEELGIAIKYLQRAGQWDSATWLKSLKDRLKGE